jgi:hypothetical protein
MNSPEPRDRGAGVPHSGRRSCEDQVRAAPAAAGLDPRDAIEREDAVPNHRMDEPEYWETPEKYLPLVEGNLSRRATFFVLGAVEDPASPVAAVLEMPPGHVIVRHAHDCERFEVVVKGSLDVGDKVLGPGDVMIAQPGEFYGPKVCGPEGCTTVEFFSRQRGIDGPILHELSDGTQIGVDYISGERRPKNIAGMEGIEERVAAVLAAAPRG